MSAGRPFADDGSVRGVTFHQPTEGRHAVVGDDILALLRTAELTGVVARDTRADVVNPHYLGGLLPATTLAVSALASGVAVVASAHGTDVTDVPAGTSALLAGLLQRCDAVTAVSPYLARRLRDDLGVRMSRTHVIPNWIDPAPSPDVCSSALIARSRRDGLLLVHSSNFRPVKRAARCVDALVAANQVVPTTLLLVGDGPDRSGVLERADALGVADLVVLAGVRDPQQAHALLAAADVVLLPSASEACSGVLLQALASGVPSVAYAVGGNSGVVVDGRTGVLVADELGGSGFAAAVGDLVADPGRRRALSAAGRAAALAFERVATVASYERVYERAVRRRSRRLLVAS